MNIDAVFIPCAGFGTRMGEAGKVVPKPLWTIADASLLELKLHQFKSLGFDKFIINTHHQAEKLNTFVRESSFDISISHEPNILGNGGSFHKIQRDFKGLKNILVTNPDSFYFLSTEDWNNFLEFAQGADNVLLGVTCDPQANYNRLGLKGEELSKIEVFGTDDLTSPITYGGMGILNLESFENVQGESSFFSTVVNSKFNKTKVYVPQVSYEFLDFGTLKDFKEIKKMLSKKEQSPMFSLLSNATKAKKEKIVERLGENNIWDKFGSGEKLKID